MWASERASACEIAVCSLNLSAMKRFQDVSQFQNLQRFLLVKRNGYAISNVGYSVHCGFWLWHAFKLSYFQTLENETPKVANHGRGSDGQIMYSVQFPAPQLALPEAAAEVEGGSASSVNNIAEVENSSASSDGVAMPPLAEGLACRACARALKHSHQDRNPEREWCYYHGKCDNGGHRKLCSFCHVDALNKNIQVLNRKLSWWRSRFGNPRTWVEVIPLDGELAVENDTGRSRPPSGDSYEMLPDPVRS